MVQCTAKSTIPETRDIGYNTLCWHNDRLLHVCAIELNLVSRDHLGGHLGFRPYCRGRECLPSLFFHFQVM